MTERTRHFCRHLVFCVAIVLAPAGLQAQQAATTVEGVLHIVWGDPHPELGSAGAIRYTLELLNGLRVPLQLTGQDTVAAHYFRKRVLVSGHVVANQFRTTAALDPWAIVVDTIAPSPSLGASAVGDAVRGTRTVMYLLLAFSDDAAVPHPPTFYTNLNNPDTPPAGEVFPATINGFFRKTSWNQLDWLGDVGGVGGVGAPGGWLILPHPKSHYAPCGWTDVCADLQAIAEDGMALGRAQGIVFTNYDNINLVLSNDLDCCAWGGGFYSPVDDKSYGVTWSPPWAQEAGTYVHELGHSVGLPHSGWVYYAYDSPWDVMSDNDTVWAQRVACGAYLSRNSEDASRTLYCTEPGDGFIAPHKNHLGWIPSANRVDTDTSSTSTVTLEANALPLSSAVKMVKICIAGSPCSGPAAHYFTVEARVKGLGAASQYDNGITFDGIIIHEFRGDRPPIVGDCFFNQSSGWAWPIDSTPDDWDSVKCSPGGRDDPNYALFNAQWNPGETYVNNLHGLSVTVVSREGSTFVVHITGTPVLFADVPFDHGFRPWIEALFKAGITSGCATNPAQYCPDGQVTRSEMAVFLERGIHGAGYTPPAASGIFADVPGTDGFRAWIEALFGDGITGGCGTNPLRYCPDAAVTRGQMAVFLLRAKHGAGYAPPPATGMFEDVPVNGPTPHPFRDWIEQLAAEGITGGCGTSPARYCPDSPVTRAQMAVFLVRAFGLPM